MKCEYNSGSNFDRQGQWMIGKYMDTYWVTGTIVESRVKYGGKVQHTIVSDTPTFVNEECCTHPKGSGTCRPAGTTFLIEENYIFCCVDETSEKSVL